jgi:hypothetical protein
MLNRLSLTGIASCISLTDKFASFLLTFPQGDNSEAGTIRVVTTRPGTISRLRRVLEGYMVECGGELRQDNDGLFLEAYFIQSKLTLMNRWAAQGEENGQRNHATDSRTVGR